MPIVNQINPIVTQVSFVHIDRLIDSICQTLNSKDNYEEICGDLLALCVITQKGVRIPAFTLREMKRYLQSFYLRFKDKFTALEGMQFYIKKKKYFSKIVFHNFFPFFFESPDEDSTPPPMKKQRKSSSSDSDFYETQSANKTNESKPDEQSPSTSMSASTPKPDEKETPTKSECPENDGPTQDDEMNGSKKSVIEQRPKANLSTSPTSLSNSSSVSTGSSPESHLLPINTSTEHEQSIEKDIERKLLQKIEYHLMDIFQHLDENETAESESGRFTQTKTNCTSDTSNTSGNITSSTSHKISSTASSVDDDDIVSEPGPSQ